MNDSTKESNSLYTSIESANPDGYDEHTKYTRVDKPNAEGYSKVSVRVGDSYKEGVKDAAGKEIIPLQTEWLVNSIEGHTALIQIGAGFLFVDLKKQEADPSFLNKVKKYEFAEQYSCGLAMVKLDDNYFYIDESGAQPFNDTYTFAESFYADRALVFKGDHKFIIDTRGKVIATLKYDQVGPFSPYVWQVIEIKNEEYRSGFINREGKEVVPVKYDEIGYYDPEFKRTRVRLKDKEGFLDEYGKVVIPIQYEYTEIFSKGKARVMLNGRDFFIDINGQEVKD